MEDLASALAAQKLSVVSDPEPVSLNGHQGLYLELHTSATGPRNAENAPADLLVTEQEPHVEATPA